MAIPRMDSREYSAAFAESNKAAERLNERISAIKNDIEKKLQVINYEHNYMKRLEVENQMKSQDNSQSSKATQVLTECSNGNFEKYGISVVPKYIKRPINLFNLQASNANEIGFRKDVEAYITEAASGKITYCTDVLKHDSLQDKDISFFELDSPDIKLSIRKTTSLLGYFSGNMIEIDPFLQGSFDIENIVFSKESKVTFTHRKIESVCRQLIVLEENIEFDQIDINISIKHNDGKLPFGLKHIYIYEAGFDKNSYCISKVKNTDTIMKIKDECVFRTLGVKQKMKLSEIKAKVYADVSFSQEIFPDTEISKTASDFYVLIPLVIRDKPYSAESFTTSYITRTAGGIFDDPTVNDPSSPEDTPESSEWIFAKTKYVPSGYEFSINSLKDIDSSFVDRSKIYIKDENGMVFGTTLELSSDKKRITVKHEYPFEEKKRYSLYIEEIKNVDGEYVSRKEITPFYAENRATSLSIDVSSSYEFYLNFSEEIGEATGVFITDASFDLIESSHNISADGKKLHVSPKSGYATGSSYSIYVDSVTSKSGVVMKENYKAVLRVS